MKKVIYHLYFSNYLSNVHFQNPYNVFSLLLSNVSFKTNLCIIFSMKPTTMFHLSQYLLWEITEATMTITCKGNFHVKHIALLAYNYSIHITWGIITSKK